MDPAVFYPITCSACDCKNQINGQLQLISSLRARIDVLETDSHTKNQNINKLRQEINDLKNSIQSIYDNIDEPSFAPRITPSESQAPVKSTVPEHALTPEELAIKRINFMVEEYFSILDVQGVILDLKDIRVEYHAKAIELFANKVIEQNQRDLDNVIELFKDIVYTETCDTDAFKDGFSRTLDFLMDICIDKPMACSFTGQLLFSAGLDYRDITSLLKPLDDDKLIEKIIRGYANALKNDVVNLTIIFMH
ncbi:hypothetical protein C1645_747519 [Glomus cerebriforme]|uniref:MI domain-containing protein n=1 Tax=Glomus cerebriforme TaxID=658196 RepID=A0A397TR15_9GLOM|nr:hypothetical protein C1645_747519 [Glomus cerebriforme]